VRDAAPAGTPAGDAPPRPRTSPRVQARGRAEALDTALAVGDLDVGRENHHGTPEERRDAWLGGFESGDPSSCARHVPR
jgi:hypothetical protein